MKSFTFTTLPTLALLSAGLLASASAQTVYRCGNRYSQTPCAGAITVHAEDPRSDAQRAAAKDNLARTTAAANQLEQIRLRDESDARKANQRAAQSQAPAQTKKRATHTQAQKKQDTQDPQNAQDERLQLLSGKAPASKKANRKKASSAVADPRVFTSAVPVRTPRKKSTSTSASTYAPSP